MDQLEMTTGIKSFILLLKTTKKYMTKARVIEQGVFLDLQDAVREIEVIFWECVRLEG